MGYYHADFPDAYVAAPVASVLGRQAGRAAGWLAEAYARAVYRRCDLTVTASPTYRRKLASLGVERLQEVPLGVDLEVFTPERRVADLWDRYFPDATSGPVLIYTGRLDREKQVEVLVAAFRRLPPHLNARLFMMGEGPLRPQLSADAADDPRFCVQNFEPDRLRLATLQASADLYVTAGPYETFGLSVLEAQASGLPVVGVAAGALPDRVPRASGPWCQWATWQPWRRPSPINCSAIRGARGLAARSWIARESSWETVFGRLIELYHESRPAVARPAGVPAGPAATGSVEP